ncbi:MAG: transmembrane sensor [Flavobacteriales bacterium]|jgi:ferric-dicitrate binding protein FerR (iron transport regulator)
MEENYLIEKWLNDGLTAEEKLAFERMENAEAYKDIVQEAQRFSASGQLTPISFDSIATRMAVKAVPERLSFKRYYKAIAAAAIIAMGLLWVWNQTPITSYNTEFGEQKVINLPDASQVTLNAKSQLVFNKENWKDERRLELQGEAFFDVAKGASFTVQTPQGIVRVLGTEFNIKERSGWFEVSCYEGVVQVETATITQKLFPGEAFRWVDGKSYLEREPENTPTWIRHFSSFDKVPIDEVFHEMERQFGVNITLEIRNPKALFSGAFEHERLDTALQEITKPFNLTYSIRTKDTVNIHDKTE